MNYKAPTKAIITDAGFASRFLPVTKTMPKAMLPIGAKPVMQLCIEECAAAGIQEVIIVTTPGTKSREIYEDYFHNSAKNVEKLLNKQEKMERFEPVKEVLNLPKVTVIEQDVNLPYGSGAPIMSARQFIDDDEAFIVIYSDDFILGANDVKSLVDKFNQDTSAKAVIAAQELPETEWHKYGMVALKDKDKQTLDHIVEKPATPEQSPSNLTSYGRYLLTPEFFTHLDPQNLGAGGEFLAVDAITKLAESGDVYVVKSKGKWLTTGDPKNYFMTLLEYNLKNSDYIDEIRHFIEQN